MFVDFTTHYPSMMRPASGALPEINLLTYAKLRNAYSRLLETYAIASSI